VDANPPRVLPGRAVIGDGNIHALMCAAFNFVNRFVFCDSRSAIEDRPNLLAFDVERPCATQSSTIGNDIRARG
jgi:hypothetical protein